MNTALHYHLSGLGAPCGAVSAAITTGLKTAAAADPEPISKAILGVAALVTSFFGQPDCNKIATTQIVEQAEKLLQQNLAAWQSLSPAEKTLGTQQAALQIFDNVWAQVVQACLTGGYGSAGQACVEARQRGACHYRDSGACWDWFIGYRDPIANDPQAGASGILSSITGGGDNTLLWLGAGVLGVGLVWALS